MRVLVARFSQETNAHNPVATRLSDFQVSEGNDVISKEEGAGTIIGGALEHLKRIGADIEAPISAVATPGGCVEDAAFEEIVGALLASVERGAADVILLDLHGAMMTASLDDPEGELLTRTRALTGPNVPILVGLDLHAHVTHRMLDAADLLVACKENPHSDFNRTGQRIAQLASFMHESTIAPKMHVAKIPMLLAGATETASGPLAEAHRILKDWASNDPAALDASLCNCQPFLDVPGMGQTVIAISDGESETAGEVVRNVAELLWERRDAFQNDFPSIAEGLHQVRSHRKRGPFVISDYGDRTNAGAPGDSVEILRALLSDFPELRAALPLHDPRLVREAQRVGLGGTINMPIGASFTTGHFEAISVTGRVEALLTGEFTMKGPMFSGQKVDAGPTALVRVGRCQILATSRAARTQDINFYEAQGVSIRDLDCVVVKSGNHFQLSYAGFATPLKVESPGVSWFSAGKFRGHVQSVFPDTLTLSGRIELSTH